MTAHKHAALMAEYAKDALETDRPWERWEVQGNAMPWMPLTTTPSWAAVFEYRRKRIPLCQVEGKDVFAGDRLWWTPRKGIGCLAEWITVGELCYGDCVYSDQGRAHAISCLSWSEPTRTKIVYQWAVKDTEGGWHRVTMYYPDEESLRQKVILRKYPEAKRLDYTALEVPCDD